MNATHELLREQRVRESSDGARLESDHLSHRADVSHILVSVEVDPQNVDQPKTNLQQRPLLKQMRIDLRTNKKAHTHASFSDYAPISTKKWEKTSLQKYKLKYL